MKEVLLFLLFIIYSINGFAQLQAPTIVWQKTFGGSEYDDAKSMIKTSNGKFVIVGASASIDGDVTGNHGSIDYWVVKFDAIGNIIWQKSFGGPGAEMPCNIIESTDGGFAIAGNSTSNSGDVSGNHGQEDIWVVKIDSSGNIQWKKCFGGDGMEYANQIIELQDGSFVVSGNTFSNNTGDVSGFHGAGDGWVIKISSIGNLIWQKCFGGTSDDDCIGLYEDQNGTFYVICHSLTQDGNIPCVGNSVLQLSANGSIISATCGIGQEVSILKKNIYNQFLIGGGWSEMYLNKFSSTGSLVWSNSYGGSHSEFLNDILPSNDGGCYLTGATQSHNDGDVTGNHCDLNPLPFTFCRDDFWIVRVGFSGNLLWQKTLGGDSLDRACSLIKLTDGYLAGGTTSSYNYDVSGNHGEWDYWVVKLSTDCISCVIPTILNAQYISNTKVKLTWNINTCTNNYMIRYRKSGTSGWLIVYTPGSIGQKTLTNLLPNTTYQWQIRSNCSTNPNYSNYSPVQYFTTPLRLENIEIENPIRIYPNPVSNKIIIEGLENGIFSFRIYNMIGETVDFLDHKIFSNGNPIDMDVSNFSSGLYLIEITNDEKSITKKFIKQ